jgi:uncharacterized membrane protein
MDFPTIIAVISGIATIIVSVFVILDRIRKSKQKDKTDSTTFVQQNNLIVNYNTKTIFDADQNKFQISEVKRTSLKIFGKQVKKNWFLLGLLSIVLVVVCNFFFLYNYGLKHPVIALFSELYLSLIILFAILIIPYVVLHHKRILVSKWFIITSYNNKLYTTDYKGQCFCGGKIKLEQNLVDLKPPVFIVCQADENHRTPFDPNIFNEDKYVKT